MIRHTKLVEGLEDLGELETIKAVTYPARNLEWKGVRFLDPTGRVFLRKGRFFRAVYEQKVGFLRSLFDKGIIDELYNKDLICKFTIREDMAVEGFSLVIEQEASDFEPQPELWNRVLYRDAALTFVDINLCLNKYGLGLIDCHPGNMGQFNNAKPKWFDLGSIAPITDQMMGIIEFISNMLTPIVIASRGGKMGRLARLLVKNGGLGIEEVKELLDLKFNASGTRGDILQSIRNILLGLDFPSENTMWSGYHSREDLINEVWKKDQSPRTRLITQLLRRFKPQSVTDIGCNCGYFSFLAADNGARVHAFDIDEPSNEHFYRILKEKFEKFRITIEVQSGVNINDSARNRTDLVMALALTHHLFLTQKFKFDYIAKALASYSNDVLITEFMPNGLGGSNGPTPFPLPQEYTLERFMLHLREHFENVEAYTNYIPADNSPRTLIVCTDRVTTGEH